MYAPRASVQACAPGGSGRNFLRPTRGTQRRTVPLSSTTMNSSAIVTFVVIGGLVWGGFLLIVVTAVRKESRKAEKG
jgi:hypothetical protein